YGAKGSGLYIDPVRTPVDFFREFLERGPILVLGQFFVPPAEFQVVLGGFAAKAILIFSAIFLVVLTLTLAKLVIEDRMARFWAAGALMALIPAATTYPHNRQLLCTSFGAMALIALLWQRYTFELRGAELTRPARLAGGVGAVLLFSHLVV